MRMVPSASAAAPAGSALPLEEPDDDEDDDDEDDEGHDQADDQGQVGSGRIVGGRGEQGGRGCLRAVQHDRVESGCVERQKKNINIFVAVLQIISPNMEPFDIGDNYSRASFLLTPVKKTEIKYLLFFCELFRQIWSRSLATVINTEIKSKTLIF